MIKKRQQTIVVIGNGMVGHRFCERLVEMDTVRDYEIVTFCEEPRLAYDRVQLTQYFQHRDANRLALGRQEWYTQSGIHLFVGDRATAIDRQNQVVHSSNGESITYDKIVLATGSKPFVPPVPGIDKKGVFVYRTIEDLEAIIEYAKGAKRAAVIGGGLLGLEAAKAVYDLGLETHVVEFAPRLMPRQIDEAGSRLLVNKINELGVKVHLNTGTREVMGNGKVDGMVFSDDQSLNVDLIVVSAGIRPRDELAREAELEMGERGGVLVDNHLRTSDPNIFAIGEVALHEGMIYGLVAPGYEMAEIVAANLTGQSPTFEGADLSTKLKLMGVDVASFGDYFAEPDRAKSITYEDPFSGAYKKLVFSLDGTQLLGGILVGDASEYGTLSMLAKSDKPLTISPHELILGQKSSANGGMLESMPDDAQVCSCNNVSKGSICSTIRAQELDSVDAVKTCTNAGTGCGGCIPLVTNIFQSVRKEAGHVVVKHLCEHFEYSRQELFEIVKIKQIKTYDELLQSHGKGNGCEVCKPAVASILASLWNENIVNQSTIQDTNDRFLANIQRGGTYSVVPRVPGGEITPEKLIVLGEVAKKYNLYTKITGGQRVDLFGAPVHQLPDIWEELVNAGFESGHAYGKAMRTVKSCVGTSWCRYAVGDSVGFAIRVENRYRGLRAPHKLKAAVSGCVRECAEAQSKDFGIIATENGWNLYVCGNGGAKPRHADLLAADLDEDTCIQYIDRFLMYYVQTADPLTRTSVWLGKLEGGIDYLRDVVVNDRLGIAAELEAQMEYLANTYKCEWKEVVDDPEKRKLFRQFVNTEDTEPSIEFVSERGQQRPTDWKGSFIPSEELTLRTSNTNGSTPKTRWVSVGAVSDFPVDGGMTIKYGQVQIAVFNFSSRGEWYATQNLCPHRRELVLSRGMLGSKDDIPKVACPLHKKTFSLQSGECLTGEDYQVKVFPVKVENDEVYLKLPPQKELNEKLSTEKTCNRTCDLQPA